MGVRISSSFSYLSLDSWVMSKIIQLATMDFCRRFLTFKNDPCGRQFDQTTQAARAAAANIAEGSARFSTSLETEMRLLDVARASLCEVLDDFVFFIMDKNQSVWVNEDPRVAVIRELRLDRPVLGGSQLHDASEHILAQKEKFAEWLNNDDFVVCANAIIVLCLRNIKMLRHQLDYLLERFKAEGGFTENMTKSRLDALTKQSEESGAPKCEKCGATMVLKTAKRGINAGHQFWSCSNYHATGCNFTRPYVKN